MGAEGEQERPALIRDACGRELREWLLLLPLPLMLLMMMLVAPAAINRRPSCGLRQTSLQLRLLLVLLPPRGAPRGLQALITSLTLPEAPELRRRAPLRLVDAAVAVAASVALLQPIRRLLRCNC